MMLPAKRKNFDLLDTFFDNFWLDENETNLYYPRVDIHDDEDNVYVEADLPGMDKKDVKVKVENNRLSINGTRDQKKESKKKGFYRCERQCGSFERSIYLGDNVDSSKAKAEFDKGVLKVIVPKKESGKPKVIDIDIK